MQNDWKALRRATLTVVSACVCVPAVAAQPVPSAEDAQKYLATQLANTATQVRFVDAAGRSNYVTGKYTGEVKTVKGGLRKTRETIEALPERVVEKQLADVRVAQLDAIDAYGRPNACATRITQVVAPDYDEHKSNTDDDTRAFSFTLKYTNEQWKYEPLTRFMNPAQVIDWSNVNIHRTAEHHITVVFRGEQFRTVQVTYFPANPDEADRIELAMRFLAMSCSAAAPRS